MRISRIVQRTFRAARSGIHGHGKVCQPIQRSAIGDRSRILWGGPAGRANRLGLPDNGYHRSDWKPNDSECGVRWWHFGGRKVARQNRRHSSSEWPATIWRYFRWGYSASHGGPVINLRRPIFIFGPHVDHGRCR